MSSEQSLRAKRTSVILKARMTSLSHGSVSEHRVRNLSETGACLDYPGEIDAGAQVRLSIGEVFDVPACVVWARQRLLGIVFDKPIDLTAARKPAPQGLAIKAGWMTDMNDAYRH